MCRIKLSKPCSRSCSSVGRIWSIQNESSFHRFHRQFPIFIQAPRAGAAAATGATGSPSKRFYHRCFTFPFALAPTNPLDKSLPSPLRHSTPTTIASQRTEAIARHLSTSPSTMSYSKQPSEFQPRKVGSLHTNDFRCYIEKDGVPVSPFHDIPLYANEQQTILNMVVEIPRWSNAKLEVRMLRLECTKRARTHGPTDLQR